MYIEQQIIIDRKFITGNKIFNFSPPFLKMPWDIVSSDFGGEETVNFGPREESGSALYQIDTFATISSQEKVCVC